METASTGSVVVWMFPKIVSRIGPAASGVFFVSRVMDDSMIFFPLERASGVTSQRVTYVNANRFSRDLQETEAAYLVTDLSRDLRNSGTYRALTLRNYSFPR